MKGAACASSTALLLSLELHAKLLAWRSSQGWSWLSGSANFTTAALDGRNVETCILVENGSTECEELFIDGFERMPMAMEDFEPGTEREPEPVEDLARLRMKSAILSGDNSLSVSYEHPGLSRAKLRVALRVPGEEHPRVMVSLPQNATKASVSISEAALRDSLGPLLASLVQDSSEGREESSPIWVVQEARLTYISSESDSEGPRARVEETGEGLPEFLDALGRAEGVGAVIEYLRRTNIRFEGVLGGRMGRPFRLQMRDPFKPDAPPEWLLDAGSKPGELAEAIYDFADRHEQKRLLRHAEAGNVNGIENFLDILVALVRLLYVYNKRGVVPKNQMLGRYYRYLRLATSGIDEEGEQTAGFFASLHQNLGDEAKELEQLDRELGFLSTLWAILLISQSARRGTGGASGPPAVGEVLPSYVALLKAIRLDLHLARPTEDSVRSAFRHFGMLADSEIEAMLVTMRA